MRDWSKIHKRSILKDRALLKEFTLDYKSKFGKLNIGCGKCIDEAYRKLTKKKMETPKFKLKRKYEGIIWKGQPVRNYDLTEKVAIDLLKNHNAKEKLFDIVPKLPKPKKRATKKEK